MIAMHAAQGMSHRPTILVVDDTPLNLALMRDLLKTDYTAKLAPSGERALKIAKNRPPDLVLLDIMMPDVDGYEVCRRLKAAVQVDFGVEVELYAIHPFHVWGQLDDVLQRRVEC